MKKETLAVFDFDGTITSKDTLLEFIKFSKGTWNFYVGFLLFAPLLVVMKLKLYPNWKAKQKLFSYFYKGITLEQFDRWGHDFSTEIDTLLRPQARTTIVSYKEKKDHTIIIISASIENWIKPWAEKSGIKTVLATQLEVDSKGCLTGKFLSKNCYGQEKVNRLIAAVPQYANYRILAYGESNGDKELLAFADEGFFRAFE